MVLKETKFEINLDDKLWFIKNEEPCKIIVSKYGIDGYPMLEVCEDKVTLKMDIIRSVPVFYKIFESKLILADDIYKLHTTSRLDEIGIAEFLSFKHPLENRTFWSDIKQVNAGEILIFDNGGTHIKERFAFREKEKKTRNHRELMNILYSIFEDFFKEIAGKKLLIPLSGGFDSRLITFMVKEFGYQDKTLTYCYGRPDSIETDVSHRVAKRLGIEWIFVRYSKDKIERIINSEEFLSFLKYTRNFPSTPHIQDFFAIKELVDRDLIDKNDQCIVVPGHSGDFVAGSRLKILKNINNMATLLKTVVGYHSQRFRTPLILKNNLKNYLEFIKNSHSDMGYSDMFEYFDWRERQAKFIVNSVRVYEFFGLGWKLPLWKENFVSFWSETDNSQRINMKLYNSVLRSLFEKYGIDFESVDEGTSKIRELFKNIVPSGIVGTIKRLESLLKSKWRKSSLYDYFDFGSLRNMLDINNMRDFRKLGFNSTGVDINAIISDLTLNLLRSEGLI